MSQSIANLTPEQKRQLLSQLLKEKAAQAASQEHPRRFPLSFAQQRLWFIDQLQPGTSVYTIPAVLRLKGALQVEALHQSLNAIVQRHEILRTGFVADAGQPYQVVESGVELSLPVIDLRQSTKSEVQAHIQQFVANPFDLTQAPLLRCQLLQLDISTYILVVAIHHIVADYWSLRVLMGEIVALYSAFAIGALTQTTMGNGVPKDVIQNQPSVLPDLAIRYVDYAVWQRQQLEATEDASQLSRLEPQLAYWVNQLSDPPPSLNLPTDYPRPAVQTFRGARATFALPPSLMTGLKALAQEHQVTLFMLLLAAFQALLYRYTDQPDIWVGSTVTNRDRRETQNLIGLFVNNLVFRARVAGEIPFQQFLQQVRETALDAYAHQDVPFETVVDALQVDRQLSHNALFQVMFILHNTPTQSFTLPDLQITALEPENATARFDLSLDMYETPDGLTGVFEYNTDLFKSTTIKRLIGHFQTLLTGIVENPETSISTLTLLTPAEHQQLITDWNQTEQPIPDRCVHELIADQAKARPDAIALIFQETTLTYRELDNRVNHLAHYLRERGVESGERVAVCLERSAELVMALLAILKVGGTYVPLDPMYPAERLRFILADAAVSLLITANAGSVGIDELVGLAVEDAVEDNAHPTGVRVLDLTSEYAQINRHPLTPSPPHPLTSPLLHSPAYLIYTSGSTGTPKGVPIRHQSLTNLLTAMAQAPGMTAQDTLLAVTTPAFDIAALELFLPLTVGGTLVIASQDAVRDPQQLAAQLIQHDVTLMQATPATWRLLLASGWQGKSNLKLLCGGEALEVALAQQLLACGSELWNLYGPTETTIWSAALKIEASMLEDGIVPIGPPIANTKFYILDSQQRPVPVGVPGELHIGGLGLSPGYWRRDDLKRERFIPHPVDAFIYKTGDLVRYLENGTLQYLGRLDHQVKLRGFRIEPGEIETVLAQHPKVAQAVVVLREDTSTEPQLVAYVVRQKAERRAKNEEQRTKNELRTHLSQHLPAYMVPSQFVVLDALPLTPNGKVDRKSLPAPARTAISDDSAAPLTPTEELLANIWSTVLGQREIARDHNFFELGGHSLLATRVVAQVRQAFGVELPLRSLFEQPTLAQLAMVVDGLKRGEPVGELEAIVPVERSTPLPLSDAQQRQWVLAQLEPESPFYIIPMAVRVQGELALDWLQQSLEHVVARHEVLRTAFQDVEGKAQLEIYPQVDVSVPLMDFSDLDEVSQQERVREQIQREARTPFDLSQASLLRMQVMRLSATDHVILLSLHHIITDGWSMGILVRELAQIYDALQFKRSVELPPLPIQYVDYAVWQQRQIERQQQQLAYWQEQLQGVPPLLELPTDYPRPAVQSFEGATYEFRLSTEQTQALQALSQQQGVTLFMTLLATFQVLLYRYSGVEDLVMGTPIANRQRSELEGLIGLFVNTLVLRTDMSGNPRFEELLGRVRAMALDAYAHQSVPFEQVVDALEVPRSWSHSPLFQVMFVLQNASEAVTFEGGALDTALAWQPLPMASDTAKFDLTLSMRLDDRGLKGTLEYRTDLFTADTMHLMAGHLRQLLKVIPQQPTSRIAELPMLTKSEQKQLRQWNQTQADYPTHLCLHQLFEQQVEKTPDAIALIAANQQLSYRELNSRANQLAHYLQKHNVGPETLVGICMERTADMVVALLAILKAGGAYVPLDPAYPEERLAFILRDAQVALLLTSQALSIPVPEAIPSITVETLWNTRLAKFPTTNPTSGVSTDHLAYVIYTSGSTGKPKGVAIEHRSPVALSHWAQAVFTAEQLSGVLAGTSLCFDLSVFELFVPLSWGGTVILAENVLQLPLIAAANEVTLVNTVPSAATALLQIDGFPATVTTLNLAGEPLPPSLVQQLYQVPHIQHVFNLYGPSEDTTYSTYARMEPNTTLSPIGHPIANTQAHILDAHLQPVPVGVPGELYLSGAGVARGYLNRPELTAERFVANPFYQGTGNREQRIEQRVNGEWVIGNSTTQLPTTHYPLPTTHYPLPSTLYKTGDRVRHLPNGSLEYLGRLDNQVKVRGFRIELAEIESALLTHTAIEQAAVNPWTDDAGNQRLVAYFVKVEGRRQLVLSEIERKAEEGDKEQGTGNREQNPIQNTLREEQSSIKFKIQNSLPHHSITPQILRQHLADQLPDYMLPALFIELDELPRLPNGKLDRGALPIPEEAERTAEAIAPTTDLEAELVAIWQELLPVAQVGIHDNFFELGGDSILALQAIAKAHRLGLQLTPRDLFQHQTIARLSATVSDWEWVQAEQGLITGPVLLTPMQRWFFDQGLAYPHHWNQAILLEVQRSLNPELLEQALGLLLAHHDALRATFAQSELSSETDGQQWQQQWLEPGPVPLTVVTGDATELAEALATTTHELQTGFDLVTGPLLRVAYLDFGAEHRRLLLVSHHLVIDGLSWRILLEDLWVAYEQLEQNHSAQLPPKTTSFKQWAEHLQAYASTEALETERGYWQRLVEFSSVSLPRDFASQDNRMAIAATVTVSLSEVDTQRLLQEVPSVYQSQINDLLLTALVLALEPWTGARRLRLELEGHGREDLPSELATVNLSRTIGWFTTLFPVALDLTEALTLGAALKQVKETLRAFPNRGLGYGVLRHLASELLPLVESEVRFNYLGQVDQVLAATTGFAPASESSGAARSPHDQRTTLLEIDGLVSGGQLRLNWTYSTAIHDRATITYLANSFLDSLRQLIDYCLTTEEDAGYTPSDFPHMSLSQGELDDLLADL